MWERLKHYFRLAKVGNFHFEVIFMVYEFNTSLHQTGHFSTQNIILSSKT